MTPGMMSRVMLLAKWAVCAGVVSAVSCGGLGAVSSDFARAAVRAPQRPGARVELDGSTVVRLAIPADERELPDAAALTVEAIQPGGRTLEVARVWTADGTGWAVAVEHGEGDAARRRQVVVDDAGTVLERSHEVAADALEGAVLRRVAALAAGEIRRVEVVQGGSGQESYRIELRGRRGERTIATCSLGGTDLRIARAHDAELRFWE